MARRFFCGHIVMFVLSWLTAASAEEPAPAPVVTKHPDGRTVTRLQLEAGELSTRDAAAALAEAARLDLGMWTAFVPDVAVPLDRPETRAAAVVWNLALNDLWSVEFQRDDTGAAQAVQLEFQRAEMERRLGQVTGLTRSLVEFALGPSSLAETWGIHWREEQAAGPRVLLLHGYNSSSGSCEPLADHLTALGYSVGVYAYPNDGPLQSSADRLAAELREFERSHPNEEVAIVAHSMGGIVARAALERDEPLSNVTRLILVATPNQGSTLARLPGGIDPYEHLLRRHVWRPGQLIADFAGDGFNEARFGLRPRSPFLHALNSRPRAPGVEYSILLGTDGPLAPVAGDAASSAWNLAKWHVPELATLNPRVEEFLTDSPELWQGHGDGVVSVERGQLDGVYDVEILHFSHHAFGAPASSPARDELWAAIERRLR